MMKQKLVILQPKSTGIPFEQTTRHQKLLKTGCPMFQTVLTSNSCQTTHNIKVPSDINVFLEQYNDTSLNGLVSLLLGTQNIPDMTEYSECETLKTISFQGHIASIKTAFRMVKILKYCNTVEFLLGKGDQLPFYIPSNSPTDADKIEPCELVTSLVIRHLSSSVNKEKNAVLDPNLNDIIDIQLKEILKHSVIAFPGVNKLVVEIPSGGKYYDLLKSYLPRWEHIKDNYTVEIRNNRTYAAEVKNVTPPSTAQKNTHHDQKHRLAVNQKRKSEESDESNQGKRSNIDSRPGNLKQTTNEVSSNSTETAVQTPKRNYRVRKPSESGLHNERWSGNGNAASSPELDTDSSPESEPSEPEWTSSPEIDCAYRNPFRNQPEDDIKLFQKKSSDFKKRNKQDQKFVALDQKMSIIQEPYGPNPFDPKIQEPYGPNPFELKTQELYGPNPFDPKIQEPYGPNPFNLNSTAGGFGKMVYLERGHSNVSKNPHNQPYRRHKDLTPEGSPNQGLRNTPPSNYSKCREVTNVGRNGKSKDKSIKNVTKFLPQKNSTNADADTSMMTTDEEQGDGDEDEDENYYSPVTAIAPDVFQQMFDRRPSHSDVRCVPNQPESNESVKQEHLALNMDIAKVGGVIRLDILYNEMKETINANIRKNHGLNC